MATIRKRGDLQWQVMVRRQGHPTLSKTFDNKRDAELWGIETEREIRRGLFIDRRETDSTTLKSALERYLIEVTPTKKSRNREEIRIKYLMGLRLAEFGISSIRPRDIAEFRDMRRKEGKADNTIRLDLALLSRVFETARRDWGFAVQNPVKEISQPKPGKGRQRRLLDGEEAFLLEFLPRAMPRSSFTKEIVLLALETGMRQSELLGVAWRDVDIRGRSIHLDDTKSGDPRDVPLSSQAIQVLEGMPRRLDGGKLFSTTQDGLVRGFAKACKLMQKEHPGFGDDLSFHDLRHEAASRCA